MIKAKALRAFAVVLLAGVLIGAAADRLLSSRDLRELSSRQADRQFRRDLLSILRPMESYPRGHRHLVGDVWTFTKAVSTEFKPLCSRDMVSLVYQPVSRDGEAEDWPVRPSEVTTARSYRFVSPPRPEHLAAARGDEHFRSAFASGCRAADKVIDNNPWAGWFSATYPEQAMDAGFAMLALQEWVKQPTSNFGICGGEADPARCKALVASSLGLGLDRIGNVGNCKSEKPDETCLVLSDFSSEFTIHEVKTGKPMRAVDIRSVDYEAMIVVT